MCCSQLIGEVNRGCRRRGKDKATPPPRCGRRGKDWATHPPPPCCRRRGKGRANPPPPPSLQTERKGQDRSPPPSPRCRRRGKGRATPTPAADGEERAVPTPPPPPPAADGGKRAGPPPAVQYCISTIFRLELTFAIFVRVHEITKVFFCTYGVTDLDQKRTLVRSKPAGGVI